jgi:hypothetical protein
VPRLPLALALLLLAARADDRVILSPDGLFRLTTGERFLPLGGFHGNVLPLSRLHLPPAELKTIEPHVWSAQTTDGQGHIDLWDASDDMMDRWFRSLAADGVTAVRLFARARVGIDVLDLCGKLNPDLSRVFHRAFAAARPYRIRFLLQILPEPVAMCYTHPDSIAKYVLPRYSPDEMSRLTPAQRRFILEGKRVPIREVFTDPDVLACQKLYLEQALDWVAREPQVFALEIYNEQGWNGAVLDGKWQSVFTFPWEDDEIRWTRQIVDAVRARLPGMPVTLSHAGFGVTGFDPLKWARPAGIDFYSSHMYAGLTGDYQKADFAAATAATSLIIRAGIPTFGGEWGLFASTVPPPIKRRSHRDAIWLSLLAGLPGFFQWTYEFPEEYRIPAEIFRSLAPDFSPQPPLKVEIGAAYRAFQDNSRYPLYLAGKLFSPGPFHRQKQQDENLRRIFAAYMHSLDIGAPIAFAIDDPAAMPLDRFAALDSANLNLPLDCRGGYQTTWLKDARHPVWIFYFRSRRVEQFGNHFAGVPVPATLDLRFHLPKGRHRGRIIDLNTGGEEPIEVNAQAKFTIPRTSDDYVLLIAPHQLRRRTSEP